MRHIALAASAAALALLVACDGATVTPAPTGDMAGASDFPVLGSITGFVAGEPTAWETIDFSVGALDASAFLIVRDGTHELNVTGYPPGGADAGAGRLRLVAALPNGPVPGPGSTPSLFLYETDAASGPRYQSTGVPLVNITDVQRQPGELYGTISGTFIATLCRAPSADAPPDPADCRDLAGEFDTRAQFDGF